MQTKLFFISYSLTWPSESKTVLKNVENADGIKVESQMLDDIRYTVN